MTKRHDRKIEAEQEAKALRKLEGMVNQNNWRFPKACMYKLVQLKKSGDYARWERTKCRVRLEFTS